MIVMSLEEFAAKRRRSQTDLEADLRPVVQRSVDTQTDSNGWSDLLSLVATLYAREVVEEGGNRHAQLPHGFREDLLKTLRQTTSPRDENTVHNITVWLATAILSVATMQAAVDDEDDVFVEWVDMHDSHVRETHREANGQVRPVGEMFDVGGAKMPYPGYPGVDIELWINCRCTLRPVLAESFSFALVASGDEKRDWGKWHEDMLPGEGFIDPPYPEDGFRDISTEERKRAAKKGHARPDGSFPIENCEDLRNAIQAIGRAKDPAKAKALIRRRKSELGCSDVQIPDTWAAGDILGFEEITQAEVDAQTSPMMHGFLSDIRRQQQEFKADMTEKPAVVVALPKKDDPVHKVGDEQKHATVAYLGKGLPDDQVEEVRSAVSSYAKDVGQPFDANVSGHGTLGDEGAQVMFIEHPEIQQARDAMVADPRVPTEADTHPHYVPHVTTHYGPDAHPDAPGVGSITFDRLAVWHGDQQDEYPLGDAMPPTDTTEKPAPVDPVSTGNDQMSAIPFHAVLAPEGIWSGDKRKFAEGALDHRPLPLPLTWQKVSAEGHDGNVTVAKVEQIAKVGNEQRASGHFVMNAEADEVVGLIGEFGRFGLSVDADKSTFELDEEEEGIVYTSSRTCSACIVPIPAFAEAWISLGEAPEGFMGDTPEETEALVASVGLEDLFTMPLLDVFKDLAPGRTEDGPGWLTHPVDTDRLRDYWVRGPGAAEIGWGTPGDFNRCRLATAKYVKPQYLAGYCANRHFDALGFWPGRPVSGEAIPFAADTLEIEDRTPAPALSLVASVMHVSPAAQFRVPPAETKVPITITDDGGVFGFIATWDECHIGYAGDCVTPPHSLTDYSYFLTGEAALDDGSRIPVGQLTIGGGHAADGAPMRAAIEHYDSTSTAWADVTVVENDIGIWCCGRVRPGTSKDMVTAAMASPSSGDWREVRPGQMEMIAAHSVNCQGFRVPRVHVAAANGHIVSLVAAGAVPQPEERVPDKAEFDRLTDALIVQLADELEAREQRKQTMAAFAARVEEKV